MTSYLSFKPRNTTYNEVLKCLKPLRKDCSPGYANIPVSSIKQVAECVTSPLTFLINSLIEKSKFPNQWKIARISHIPKS